ncbi:MAG: hypothetical protein C4586_08345 [Anaerolineaceae bacterium]|nr:MAG: hypothetical protein C4586_08345 [Anaerolineaceae bacterium]
MIQVKKNEATAALRRMYFHCVDATDGMTPETLEAGGQPQIAVNGPPWANTGIGVLVAIGNGRYYAELTQDAVNIADRSVIEGRYKSANTAEALGTTIQIIEYPVDASVASIITRIGAFTGTGVNTVLGAVRALASKVASAVSDIGGTFDPATDSLEALQEKLVAGVTVSPLQVGTGVLRRIVVKSNNATIRVKRGDVDTASFNLGATFFKSGGRYFFCAKESQNSPNSTAIVNREMTVTDAANCAMNIIFTANELAVVDTYYAEIERRDADGTSNPLTCWEGKLEISQDTRQ